MTQSREARTQLRVQFGYYSLKKSNCSEDSPQIQKVLAGWAGRNRRLCCLYEEGKTLQKYDNIKCKNEHTHILGFLGVLF